MGKKFWFIYLPRKDQSAFKVSHIMEYVVDHHLLKFEVLMRTISPEPEEIMKKFPKIIFPFPKFSYYGKNSLRSGK